MTTSCTSNVYLLKDPKALGQKPYEFKKEFKKALTKFVLKINCILITKTVTVYNLDISLSSL